MSDIVIPDTEYKRFFDILQEMIKSGHAIEISDEPKKLQCGFAANKNRYLMKITGLKYAQRDGIDVSLYMNLKK